MAQLINEVSRVIDGGSFTWKFTSNYDAGEHFVERLVSAPKNDVQIFKFTYTNGKENKTLENFPLYYDVKVMNMNPRWRLNKVGQDMDDSIFVKILKSKYYYRRTLPTINCPDLEDLFLAVDLTFKNTDLFSAFPTYISSTLANLVLAECLEPRSFLNSHINNYIVENKLRGIYLQQFIKTSSNDSLKFNDDSNANYSRYNLPLDNWEAEMIETYRQIFESLHISYSEAITLNMNVRLFDSAYKYNLQLNNMLSEHVPARIRIPREACISFMHEIYCLTPSMARYADAGITRTIKIELDGDDPDTAYTNMVNNLFLNLAVASPLTTAVQSIEPSVVASIAVAFVKIYSNPNIYSITLSNMPQENNYSLSSMFGIFTLQSLFTHEMLEDSTKRHLTNHLARFITSYYTTIPWNDNCNPNVMTVKEWYTVEDRMRNILEMFTLLPAHIQRFLSAYYGIDLNANGSRTQILTGDNSLNLPYAGHRLDGAIHLNYWNGDVNDIIGRRLLRPILPYDSRTISEWSGGPLQNVMTCWSAVVNGSSSSLKTSVKRYEDTFKVGTARLKGILNLLISRAYIVATSPYCDDIFRQNINHRIKILLPINLEGINSCLIYPSADVDSMPLMQSPSDDYDLGIQTMIPILKCIMARIRTLAGDFNLALGTPKLCSLAMNKLKDVLKLDPALIKKVTEDTVGLNAIINFVDESNLTPYAQTLLSLYDKHFSWLATMRYVRGYRDHFYISKEIGFLNVDIESTTNAFYTNGVISDDLIELVRPAISGMELQSLLYRYNVLHLPTHDLSAIVAGVDGLKFELDSGKTAFDLAKVVGIKRKVIRVNHPCIVKFHIMEMENRLQAPKRTVLNPNVDFERTLRMGLPFEIDVTLQFLNSSGLIINSTSYNKHYHSDDLVITSSLYPLPINFMSYEDYSVNHNNYVVLRKEPCDILTEGTGVKITGEMTLS